MFREIQIPIPDAFTGAQKSFTLPAIRTGCSSIGVLWDPYFDAENTMDVNVLKQT